MSSSGARFIRGFWTAFVPLLVPTGVGVAILARKLLWNEFCPDGVIPRAPTLELVFLSVSLLALWAIGPGVLAALAAAAHLVVIRQPAPSLAGAGQPLREARARCFNDRPLIGRAGRLYLTPRFLIFVPSIWRFTGERRAAEGEVIIPVSEIAVVRRGGVPLANRFRLRVTRPSGDHDTFSVWRPRRWLAWLPKMEGQATVDLTPARRWHLGRIASAVILLPLGAFVVARVALSLAVAIEINGIRADGFPVSFDEIPAYYAQPTGPNAADDYVKAFKRYVMNPELESGRASLPWFGSGERQLPQLGQRLPADLSRDMASYLEPNKPALELLQQASAIPDCRFPVSVEMNRIEDPADSDGGLYYGAQLITMAGFLALHRGDPEVMADAIAVLLHLARHQSCTPFRSTTNGGRRSFEVAAEMAERLVTMGQPDDATLARLALAFQEAVDAEPAVRALAYERAARLSSFDFLTSPWRSRTGTESPYYDRPLCFFYWLSGMKDLDLRVYLRGMARQFELTHARPTLADTRLAAGHGGEPYCCVAEFMLQLPRQHMMFESERQTRMVAASTGLAAARYRLAHGRLPDRVEDLCPAYLKGVPIDPVDGKTLRYKRTGRTVGFYGLDSMGQDGGVRSPIAEFFCVEIRWDEPQTTE